MHGYLRANAFDSRRVARVLMNDASLTAIGRRLSSGRNPRKTRKPTSKEKPSATMITRVRTGQEGDYGSKKEGREENSGEKKNRLCLTVINFDTKFRKKGYSYARF